VLGERDGAETPTGGCRVGSYGRYEALVALTRALRSDPSRPRLPRPATGNEEKAGKGVLV
jgi:hypothetical protein